MGNFDGRGRSRNDRRGGFGGRNRSFGGRDRHGRDRGERQMYKVVCSNCGKDCEVPFRPTNDKPVYCSDCFEKFGGRGSDKRSFDRPRNEGRNNDNLKPQLEALNTKLDKIISLLEPKVTEEEPVKLEMTEEKVSEPEAVEEVTEEKVEEKVEEKAPEKKKVTKKKTTTK